MNLFRRAIALNQEPAPDLGLLRSERKKPSPPSTNSAFGHMYNKFDENQDFVQYQYSLNNNYQIVVKNMPKQIRGGRFLWELSLFKDSRHVDDLQLRNYFPNKGIVRDLTEKDVGIIIEQLKNRLSFGDDQHSKKSIWDLYTSLMLANDMVKQAGEVVSMVKALEEKAKHGHADAQYRLANLYYYGKAVNKDYKSALYWLKQASTSDYAPAQYLIGKMFREGLGVSQDIPTATRYFTFAANQGYSPAIEMLKNSDLKFNSDLAQRFHDYLYGAHKKNPEAQYQLGLLYRYNRQDLIDLQEHLVMDLGKLDFDKEAFKLFDSAANKGHAPSQHEMGETYFYGYGVSESMDRAKEWYAEAAKQEYKPSKDKLKHLS
jgi:hypothetical protein